VALLATGCPGFRSGYADVPALEASIDAAVDAIDVADGSDVSSIDAVDAPFIDAIDAPTVDVPSVDVVDAPTVDVPSVDVVDVPAIDVPAIDVPAIDVPAIDVPAIDVPAIDVPAIDVPAIDVPAIDVPAIDVPAIDVRAIDVPPADVPVDRALPTDTGTATPRPVGPPVGAMVTSLRPSLRWRLGGTLVGAAVEVCRDRACTVVESTFDATGTSGTLPVDLPTGPHFWRLRGLTGGGRLSTPSATWQFWISPLRPPRESAYGSVLDLDGDGHADFAVGSPSPGPGAGRVFVWRGPLSTASSPLVLSAADEGTVGFGQVVTSVGDVDGDGITDLGVTSYDAAEIQGTVEIFQGNTAFAAVRGRRLTTPGELTFGFSLDGAGDTDGDGYADVIVGQPEAASGHGRAHIYLGGAAGLGGTIALSLTGRDLAGARFGYAVAGGADVDNDAYADVLVAGPGAPVSQGGAYVYLGSATGVRAASRNILASDGDPDGRYGAVVAHLGDINDDGFSDFGVGAPGNGTHGGRVLLFLGSGVGVSPTPAAMLPAPAIPTEYFGAALAGLGDLDDDGVGDLAIGAPAAGFGGRVTIVYGARSVTPALRRTVYNGLTGGGAFGTSIASLDPLGDSFVAGAPIAFSVGRYVPMGSTSPTSPVFIYSLAERTGFGQSIAGIW
jgi:hypothetical protein